MLSTLSSSIEFLLFVLFVCICHDPFFSLSFIITLDSSSLSLISLVRELTPLYTLSYSVQRAPTTNPGVTSTWLTFYFFYVLSVFCHDLVELYCVSYFGMIHYYSLLRFCHDLSLRFLFLSWSIRGKKHSDGSYGGWTCLRRSGQTTWETSTRSWWRLWNSSGHERKSSTNTKSSSLGQGEPYLIRV